MIGRKLVVGNWKMNGSRAMLGEIAAIGRIADQHPGIDVGLCLPATLIADASAVGGTLFMGGQDCHPEQAGAHTGSLSAAMLRDVGAGWVMVGHSERRVEYGEGDALVAAKAQAAQRAGLNVILCVGESRAARDAGDAEQVVVRQLLASLPGGASADWLTIAYEPVWAIGTGQLPTDGQIAAMHAALRAALSPRIGGEGAAMRILYGGSMCGPNAARLMAIPDVDGGLVGRASLSAAAFAPVIAAAGSFARTGEA